MDYKYIEQLLDRYFEGETTLQEEQILKTFFAQEHPEMPQEVAQWAPLFVLENEEATLPEDFDQRMLDMTENVTQVKARTISLTQRLRPLFGAAAVVAILLTLGNAINQSMRANDIWIDTDAYARVKQVSDEPALAFDQVSDSMKLAKDNIVPATPADSLLSGNLN